MLNTQNTFHCKVTWKSCLVLRVSSRMTIRVVIEAKHENSLNVTECPVLLQQISYRKSGGAIPLVTTSSWHEKYFMLFLITIQWFPNWIINTIHREEVVITTTTYWWYHVSSWIEKWWSHSIEKTGNRFVIGWIETIGGLNIFSCGMHSSYI